MITNTLENSKKVSYTNNVQIEIFTRITKINRENVCQAIFMSFENSNFFRLYCFKQY